MADAASHNNEAADWKTKATEHLLNVFITSMRRSNPNADLRPLIPVIREVITSALAGVEERVRLYAEHLSQPSSQKRAEEEARLLVELEQSIQQLVTRQLAASRRQAEQRARAEGAARHQSGA